MMGFGRAFKRVTKGISSIAKSPLRAIALTTTGGASLLAPPAQQAQIGAGIVSFAAGAGAGLLGAPKPPTSAELYARTGGGAPQGRRGHSPSSYAQRRGTQRQRMHRRSFLGPPDAGSPPSDTGFHVRRFRA